LWCDEESSKFVDQRKKKIKLQWLQDPSHINAYNGKMYDVKTANSARKKRREYLRLNIYKLQTHSKNNNITDLHTGTLEFKNS
jgi:serine/threonine-protein kinase RIO1